MVEMQGILKRRMKKLLGGIPREDSYAIAKFNPSAAVADGVTRDLKNGRTVRRNALESLENWFFYPRFPDPAQIAADLAVKTFNATISDYNLKDANTVRAAIREANGAIGLWKKAHMPQCDYAENDRPSCTFAGIVPDVRNGVLHYGFICDSGLAIFDENGKVSFRTPDEGPSELNPYFWKDERLKDIKDKWQDRRARQIIRVEFRNNPDNSHSYGVLSGEDSAMYYVKTGTLEFKPGQRAVIYTDGAEPTTESEEFAQHLIAGNTRAIERLLKRDVKSEGTLVITEF